MDMPRPSARDTAFRRTTAHLGPRAFLIQIYPPGYGIDPPFALGERALVLGREKDCDLVVNEPSVSCYHVRLEPHNGKCLVVDLGSTNGTLLNGIEVRRAALRDGDSLRLGDVIFRFLIGDNLEAVYHAEMYQRSTLDALTGLHNRGCLERFLDRESSRSTRHSRPLSVLMFDVDHFKSINDTLGHAAGDQVLRELAGALCREVRAEDLLARYGGDEFAWVLVETAEHAARECAARARALVAGHLFHYQRATIPVSISVGVGATPGGTPESASEMLMRADADLYVAKRAARRVDPVPAMP